MPIRRKLPIGFRMVYLQLNLAILKIKVKLMQIFTVNISLTVTDGTNIAIAYTKEVACWLLSNVVFTFDIDPF